MLSHFLKYTTCQKTKKSKPKAGIENLRKYVLNKHQMRLDKLSSELHETRSELGTVNRMVHDIREKEYVTFLHDFSGRVHAGNDAEAYGSMFIARRPFNSDVAFRHLYTLSPVEIKEIGRSSSILVLCSLLMR